MLNLFAWRARDPAALLTADDPVGPDNDEWLEPGLEGGWVVAAWGSTGGPRVGRLVAERLTSMRTLMPERVMCLGTSADGNPRHPLMLPYATELMPWEPPAGGGDGHG